MHINQERTSLKLMSHYASIPRLEAWTSKICGIRFFTVPAVQSHHILEMQDPKRPGPGLFPLPPDLCGNIGVLDRGSLEANESDGVTVRLQLPVLCEQKLVAARKSLET